MLGAARERVQDRKGVECLRADPSTCAWFSVGSSPLHLSHVTLSCAVSLTGGNEPSQLADAKMLVERLSALWRRTAEVQTSWGAPSLHLALACSSPFSLTCNAL